MPSGDLLPERLLNSSTACENELLDLSCWCGKRTNPHRNWGTSMKTTAFHIPDYIFVIRYALFSQQLLVSLETNLHVNTVSQYLSARPASSNDSQSI
jgi:hypothetical protein